MTKAKKTHNMPRLTRQQIQESNRLREVARSTGWTFTEIAAVCKCHPDTIKKWINDGPVLSVERQMLLRAHWSAETGGPG
jgi:hypothetical protein